MATELGQRRAEAYALSGLAMVRMQQGDLASARVRDEEALALFREVGDRCRSLRTWGASPVMLPNAVS